MITKKEREALELRREAPDTLKMIAELHKPKNSKLRLIYPDGSQKVVNVTDVNIQKMARYCDDNGVQMESVES